MPNFAIADAQDKQSKDKNYVRGREGADLKECGVAAVCEHQAARIGQQALQPGLLSQ